MIAVGARSPATEPIRVAHGGAWKRDAGYLRATNRDRRDAESRNSFIGWPPRAPTPSPRHRPTPPDTAPR